MLQVLETVTARPIFENSSAGHLVESWIASLRSQ